MPLKVYVPNRQVRVPLPELRSQLPPTVEIVEGDEPPAGADYEVLIAAIPTPAMLQASPNLRAVITPFAGTPKETIEMLREYPQISLHSLHYNVNPTAEMAIGLLIAASKFMVSMDQALRKGDWRGRFSNTPALILDKRRVTIVGYGRIGRRIGAICHALGMHIVGVRRHVQAGDANIDEEDGVAIYPPSTLHDLLPRTDVLMLATPRTPETEGMIGAAELALLPDHAILVNVGRAHVVDEEALYVALRDRAILAAGLDVWYQYPTDEASRANTHPSRFPFHELENVVMSPHRGGWLNAAEGDRIAELARFLIAADEGLPIPSPVDKELGY